MLRLWRVMQPFAACWAALFASLVGAPSNHPEKFL
jgi:hypothetical protein